MKAIRTFFTALLCVLPALCSNAQENIDVFIPIAKYLEQGNAEKLSAWFDETLEISVPGVGSDMSRNQARQIMKKFFSSVRPNSFLIQHAASKSNMKYALGVLTAGSIEYNVTIFVSFSEDGYKIQQLKIEELR